MLQVGANPPGIKTSFSLPLRRGRSTALLIPRCLGSRASEVHTRSVLSSRITCSPTVRTVLLSGGGIKVRRVLLGGWVCVPSQPHGGGETDGRHVRDRGISALTATCTRASHPRRSLRCSPPSLNSHPRWVRGCQLTFRWPGLEGKITIRLPKTSAI